MFPTPHDAASPMQQQQPTDRDAVGAAGGDHRDIADGDAGTRQLHAPRALAEECRHERDREHATASKL
jgi:hypothetical protein